MQEDKLIKAQGEALSAAQVYIRALEEELGPHVVMSDDLTKAATDWLEAQLAVHKALDPEIPSTIPPAPES